MNSHSHSVVLAYPEKIDLFFLLMNSQNELVQVVNDSYSFLSEGSSGDDEYIYFAALILKIKQFSQYQLTDSFMFQVDLDDQHDLAEDILEEDVTHIMNRFFKPLPFLNDILISPSLTLFHNVHSLFFIMKEKPKSGLPKLVFNSGDSQPYIPEDISLPIFHKTRKHYPDIKRHNKSSKLFQKS